MKQKKKVGGQVKTTRFDINSMLEVMREKERKDKTKKINFVGMMLG